MLVQTQVIINLLESKIINHEIDFYNNFTFLESKAEKNAYRKVIAMIRDLENKGSRA